MGSGRELKDEIPHDTAKKLMPDALATEERELKLR
jgi:hypothetical protein